MNIKRQKCRICNIYVYNGGAIFYIEGMNESLNPFFANQSAPSQSGSRIETAALKQKWQGAIRENAGFVAVPVVLLRAQKKLNISATELNVLLNLMSYWWGSQTAVFPRTSIIAKRMGVTDRTVQRCLDSLVKKKLIVRERDGEGRRVLLLHPLADKVAAVADSVLWQKEKESFDA